MALKPGVTVMPGAAAHSYSTKGWSWFQREFCVAKLDVVTTPAGQAVVRPSQASVVLGSVNMVPVVRSPSKLWRSVLDASNQAPGRSRPESNTERHNFEG